MNFGRETERDKNSSAAQDKTINLLNCGIPMISIFFNSSPGGSDEDEAAPAADEEEEAGRGGGFSSSASSQDESENCWKSAFCWALREEPRTWWEDLGSPNETPQKVKDAKDVSREQANHEPEATEDDEYDEAKDEDDAATTWIRGGGGGGAKLTLLFKAG